MLCRLYLHEKILFFPFAILFLLIVASVMMYSLLLYSFFLFSFQFISFHRQHTISYFYFFYFLLHFKTDFYRSVLDVWLQVCRFVCVHPAACRHGSSVEMILGMAAAPYSVSIECELTKPDCDCAVIHLLLNFVQKPFFFFLFQEWNIRKCWLRYCVCATPLCLHCTSSAVRRFHYTER